jgi:hypothetical protein
MVCREKERGHKNRQKKKREKNIKKKKHNMDRYFYIQTD